MSISQTDRAAAFAPTRGGSKELFDRATAVIPAGVNHALRFHQPFPLYYSRGDGALKYDVDGNSYVDYHLASASLLLGHDPAPVRDALAEAVQSGWAPSVCHDLEVRWAELVAELIPCAELTRFVASGTESTFLAARIVRAHTGRSKIIRLAGHYHGWNDFFMVGLKPPFDQVQSAGVLEDVLAHTITVPSGDREALRSALEGGDVAAVFVEPSGGAWSTVPLSVAEIEAIAEETRAAEALLVFDEMITGFRWAPGGAQERFGVTPDLTTLGKILTGGLPGGAVTGRAEVMERLRPGPGVEDGYVFHFGTFNGHPFPAAAGSATLEIAADGAPQRAAEDHAVALRAAIQEQIAELGIDGFVYGESSTFHIYLRSPDSPAAQPATLEGTSDEELLSIPATIVGALQIELRTRGVDLMSYTGGVTSAAHGEAELARAGEAFGGALRSLRDDRLIATR
ncbi:MAG TPA: aminotransferase class III-fold pyridoxal phosphate-dependent enzyme [Solirubrobacterales bacterium]|jgi:glutamate-1-semialdehyde 2,1-aminomutase